ncbi:NTP transferase domain-containing protein [bacterium]|nr:NTP transferase domain-containing protein [bacterium]
MTVGSRVNPHQGAPAPPGDTGKLWAIVLAGGTGTRLAPLIRELYGFALPKQFAVLEGHESLLQATIDRIGRAVPPARVVVVVDKAYVSLARRQLTAYPGIEVVGQPANAGTGPGLLLPLARVRARDPNAIVAVFPSDHHVSRPRPLLRAVRNATEAVRGSSPGALVLLGVAPDGAETEYGWILPGARLRASGAERLFRVDRFVEKPNAETARRILERGGLWNSFISVGRVATYWRLAGIHLPAQVAMFERYFETIGGRSEESTLDRIYARMTPADFSRSVLQNAGELAVVPVRDSGWSDWGTPGRVLDGLRGALDRAGSGASAKALPVQVRRLVGDTLGAMRTSHDLLGHGADEQVS